MPLGRDDQRAVLSKCTGVAEVCDVFARGALPRLPSPLHGVGPRGIERKGVALVHLGEIGTHRIQIDVL